MCSSRDATLNHLSRSCLGPENSLESPVLLKNRGVKIEVTESESRQGTTEMRQPLKAAGLFTLPRVL